MLKNSFQDVSAMTSYSVSPNRAAKDFEESDCWGVSSARLAFDYIRIRTILTALNLAYSVVICFRRITVRNRPSEAAADVEVISDKCLSQIFRGSDYELLN